VDQRWRADSTYIRLRDEFVFLAVILDAYSRRVVEAGLIPHSDRGSQYASHDYTDLLKANGIAIGMSRKGNPWDNAACESFMKTLKYEEVLRNEYRDLADARASIREFLEKIYNHKRLHSALGYVPPARFERNQAGCSPAWPASAPPAGNQYAVMSSCRSRSFQRTATAVPLPKDSLQRKRLAIEGIQFRSQRLNLDEFFDG